MPTLETDVLADLIRAKRECLLQLRELGRKQLELIDGGEMTALLDLLALKQKPIAQLQRIEKALDPFRGQDPERRTWSSPEAREACAEQLREIEMLLAEVIKNEKFCEAALIRRRDEVANQLQGAHLAGCARTAYTGASDYASHSLDLSSGR
jgi:hypothetical protein